MKIYEIRSGDATRLGAWHDGEGVNFAVFSQNVSQIDVCLFDDDGGK